MATWVFSTDGYGYVAEEHPEIKPEVGICTRIRKMTPEEVEQAIQRFMSPPHNWETSRLPGYLLSLIHQPEKKEL